jgi:hypothetical protein
MKPRLFLALLVPPMVAVAQLPQGAGAQRPPWEKAVPPPAAAVGGDAADQPTLADDSDTIEAGQKWLMLIDEGRADAAWDVASTHLRSVVTRDQWINGIRRFRKPFGKLASRKAVKFGRAHSMPGAPDGDYAIIEYESTFANGKHATEQLIWMLEGESSWRVSGYYIR